MCIKDSRYRRFAEDIRIKDLPAGLEGLKIVQISDMHSGSWTQSDPLKAAVAVSYTTLRAHETKATRVCQLLLEKHNPIVSTQDHHSTHHLSTHFDHFPLITPS